MERCPSFGARELKNIAANLERPVIEKTLTHLGLDPQPPRRGERARQGKTPPPESRRPGRHKDLGPGCNAKPQPGRRRATRKRGTNGFGVDPENSVTSERL